MITCRDYRDSLTGLSSRPRKFLAKMEMEISMSKQNETLAEKDAPQKLVWETPEIEVLDARNAEAAFTPSGMDFGIYS